MIKAVLFDMDGTILDTERIHKECWEKAMCDVGIEYLPTTFYDLIGLNDNSTRDYFRRVYGFSDELYYKMSAAAYSLSREYGTVKGIPVKKGFFELSDYLLEKKIKRAVVTSSTVSEALHNFERAGIKIPFDTIIGGDIVKEGKPSAEPFLKAAAALGLSTEECIVAEDSANGVRSAHNACIRCVYIKDLVDIPKEARLLAEYEAKSLDKIIGIIDGINK